MNEIIELLGVPAVHYDGKTNTATVMVTIDALHLGCFLSGVDHLEQQHGPFHIPNTLPADVSAVQEGE